MFTRHQRDTGTKDKGIHTNNFQCNHTSTRVILIAFLNVKIVAITIFNCAIYAMFAAPIIIILTVLCSRSKDLDVSQSPKSRGFRLFNTGGGGGHGTSGSGGHVTSDTGTLTKDAIMSRVGQR